MMSASGPFLALFVVSLQAPTAEGPEPAPAAESQVAPVPGAPASEVERPVSRRSLREQFDAADQRAWDDELARLKLHTGLSGGFAAAMVVAGTLLFVLPGVCSDPDPEFGCGEHFAPYIAGAAMFVLAPIPIGTSIYWGVRLHRHKQRPPGGSLQLQLTGGGFTLRF